MQLEEIFLESWVEDDASPQQSLPEFEKRLKYAYDLYFKLLDQLILNFFFLFPYLFHP